MSKVIRKFTKDELLAEDLPDSALLDSVVDIGRWSVCHEIVFKLDGKHWKTTYLVGATEYQDEAPWEYDKVIEATQVEKREVVVEQWVAVDE